MMADEGQQQPRFADPIVERNYNLLYHYLIFLLDAGLDYLKREFITRNSNSQFQQFSATSYYNFILRDYIRERIRNQLKTIMQSAVECVPHFHDDQIELDFLDEVIEKRLPKYHRNDLTLINTSITNPGHQELKMIATLTFRISVIQCTRMLSVKDPNIENYNQLVRVCLPSYQQCRNSVNAILSMVDKMIDCFEANPEMINIPFYTPVFSVRDFQYVRSIYEYALKTLDEQLQRLYFSDKYD